MYVAPNHINQNNQHDIVVNHMLNLEEKKMNVLTKKKSNITNRQVITGNKTSAFTSFFLFINTSTVHFILYTNKFSSKILMLPNLPTFQFKLFTFFYVHV